MSPITHLWQSTVCAGVAALLAVAFRHGPARTRYNIWLAASVKFLLPLGLLVDVGRYAATSIAPAPSPADVSTAARWLSAATDPVAAGLMPGLERAAVIALMAIWVSVAISLSVWRWRQWMAVSTLVASGTRDETSRPARMLQQAPRSSARPISIALVACESAMEPGIVGALRPALLWPAGLSDRLTDAELTAIVAHEAAHVDRRDNLTALLHTVVETIFWFNPVVWWIGSRLVNERERACDEAVVHTSVDTRSYAEGILKVCGFCLRSRATFVAGVGSSNLRERIEWIVTAPKVAPLSVAGRVLLAGIVCAAIGAPMAAGAIGTPQSASQVYNPKDKGIQLPKLIKEVKPNYTAEAKNAKISGLITLDVVVLKDGKVGDVKVTKSLDKKYGLDAEAIATAKKWLFAPGTKDGKPVDVRVEVEMTFTLR